jgi:type I restriction enzyme, S subunit
VAMSEGLSGWRDYLLGEIAQVQTGPFGSQLHMSDYKMVGVPIITVEHLGENKILHNNLPLVGDEDRKRLIKYTLQEGDIVFSRVGSVDRRAYVSANEDGWMFSGRCLRVRANKGKVEPRFLSYYFGQESFKETIRRTAVGATMPSINTAILSETQLSIPPFSEQTLIAAVLSSLDNKIDLLHRQNKTLESMAETLFRQWFIEGAKEDWEDGTIADLIEFNPFRKLSKGDVVPYLEMASLNNSTFNPTDWYDRAFSSGSKFINGDTLLARITPCLENGKTAYVTFLDKNQVCWGSTEYIVMRPKGELHPFFAYALARNTDFREYAKGCLAGSSGRQRVELQHLKNYVIKIPPQDIVSEFNSLAESITPKLHSNFLQIRTLEKLRDTLLPKLMSGEVRVEV